MPPAGVAMLLPIARTFTGIVPAVRERMRPSSRGPRTQCPTTVGSVRTLSNPSCVMCSAISLTAASACADPVGRGPTDTSFSSVA